MTEKKLGETVFENFKIILTKKNLTIPDVAKKLGSDRRTVNIFLDRLKSGTGTLKTICKYANALFTF